MFDLDHAIADWRRRMLAAGIKSPVPLDELEEHLRDDVEQEERSGLGTRQAFQAAVQRLGQANEIKSEFEAELSNDINQVEDMKRHIRNILASISILAIGLALILPEVSQWRSQGALPGAGTALFLLGVLCAGIGAVCGIWGAVSCLRKSKA